MAIYADLGANVMSFKALNETQCKAIRALDGDWATGVNWLKVRLAIARAGRDYWKKQAERSQRRRTAKQREDAYSGLTITLRLQKRLKRLADDFEDYPDPDLKLLEYRFRRWLSDYKFWSSPFIGRKDPIQAELEWQLMCIWTELLGGRLGFSRKHGVPYGPLIEFLATTLKAILGKKYRPPGLAKMIERHRKSQRARRSAARELSHSQINR
jgi:hypothetical protein